MPPTACDTWPCCRARAPARSSRRLPTALTRWPCARCAGTLPARWPWPAWSGRSRSAKPRSSAGQRPRRDVRAAASHGMVLTRHGVRGKSCASARSASTSGSEWSTAPTTPAGGCASATSGPWGSRKASMCWCEPPALPASDVELKIYGGLEDYPQYVAAARAAAGDPRITFCGTFANQEIGRVFAGIDVLVVPSVWYENTPLVISSAQQAGCPVIASDMPACPRRSAMAKTACSSRRATWAPSRDDRQRRGRSWAAAASLAGQPHAALGG